jgi:NADH:ubiquinone reductase (H+-translocating)
VLLEGSDRVLGAFVEPLSERAREQLVKLRVDVRTGGKVTGIDADGVDFETRAGDVVTRHRLPSKTVIWAAGVAGSPLGRSLAATAGAMLDRAGRVIVRPDLTLTNHPEITVIGDLASAMSYPDDPSRAKPKPVPGVSPAAKQMGRTAAANLVRRLRGQPTLPFRYTDYGSLATIGRKAAVVDLTVPYFGALRFSGFPAWLFWLFAHIWFLIGFRNRLFVMIDWGWSYFTHDRAARVVAEPAEAKRGAELPR